MNIFDALIVNPIINALLFVYLIISSIGVPFALGFSIIVLTIIIRFILYPLTTSQLRASKKMQELNPHISKLKEKHKGDAKTIQAETMKLYKEFGVNPLAGCLPLIVQLPVIWGLYSVLNKVIHLGATTVAEVNKIAYSDALKLSGPWNVYFFGLPLADNPSHLMNTMGPIILFVPILTGALQFVQSKMMLSSAPTKQEMKIETKKEKKNEDFASAFQKQSMYIFPFMIGFFSFSFPIGLSLYWNTFTVFGIIQQYRVSGLGGVEEWINKYGKGFNK